MARATESTKALVVTVLAGESDAVLDAKFLAASGFQPCSTICSRILRAGSLARAPVTDRPCTHRGYRGIWEWVPFTDIRGQKFEFSVVAAFQCPFLLCFDFR
jgi:hypothetical protein